MSFNESSKIFLTRIILSNRLSRATYFNFFGEYITLVLKTYAFS